MVNGAAGLGSAICAAVACGAYASFEEAVENMVKIKDGFVPNEENHQLYQRILPVYTDITNHTDEILKKTYEIFQ